MLSYWHSENDGFSTYSIDMLRFDFTVSEQNLQYLVDWFNSPINYYAESFGLSTSPFKYRYLFKLNYPRGSMVVGLGFNGIHKDEALKCFVEVNPNKVFVTSEPVDDIFHIVDHSRRFKLRRFDLAIDIPLSRDMVQLVKDQRKYGMTMKSLCDKTEYLGARNEGGFIKLYNKTIESKLDSDVTRLELTCDSAMTIDDIVGSFPRLLFLPLQNELVLDDSLSSKDRLLVDLLKLHPEMFNRLDYRNKKKLEKYVFSENTDFSIDKNCVRNLLAHLRCFEK